MLRHKILNVLDVNRYNYKVASTLEEILVLPERLYTMKLSCGSERPPERSIDYVYRAVSLLKYLVENPCGIKKLQKKYSKVKRSQVKPPKLKEASYYALKVLLNELVQKGFLEHSTLGYYASSKGKQLLQSNL